MATRRTSRKKEPAEAPVLPSEPESPVVTQVVEEISDEKPGDVIEEIKEEAQKIEEAADKLEDVLPVESATAVPEVMETTGETNEAAFPSAREEKAKERAVVSELYKPKSSLISPEYVVESGSSMKPLLIWSLVVIGIALLTGGTLLVAVKGLQGAPFMAKPTPTPMPTPTPTPTPAPAVTRADITVGVLNGGGVAGSGAKMKAFLEEKGYTVSEVKNADEFTFEETEVHVKPGNIVHANLLKKDLGEKYTIGSAAASLAADSPFNAQVIVGKK